MYKRIDFYDQEGCICSVLYENDFIVGQADRVDHQAPQMLDDHFLGLPEGVKLSEVEHVVERDC